MAMRETVAFDVLVGDVTIRCEAAARWLVDAFQARGTSRAPLIHAVQQNLEEILQIVAQRLSSQSPLPPTLLSSADEGRLSR